jgi:LruC domain-containing protein
MESLKDKKATLTVSNSKKIARLNMTTILIVMFSFASISINAQEYLRLYTGQPGSMVSNVTGGTITTEDFHSFSVPPNNFIWAATGYNSTIGTYSQTAGQSYVKKDDRYGAGTSNYMSIKTGGKVKLDLINPVTYFGFAWPAGDGSNTINVKRNGVVIGSFSTSDIIALLPKNASNIITAINGTQYTTNLYYGKPGTGQNSNEPYSYLHFVASSGLAFDEIELTMGAGGEFENDNHSIIASGTPILQGDWVELITILPPVAHNDNAITPINTTIDINILANDDAGDVAIDPSTVSFVSGTEPNPSTEGTFTVNPTSGLVTFTPITGFLGTVTIDYEVCDINALCTDATITVIVSAGTSNLYPALGPGTLGFEDLWPAKGDYDFNDLVIDYQFEVNSDVNNFVEDVVATFTIKAFGASFENGFGFQLAPTINASNLSVSGYDLKENFITLNGNGTEAGQANATIIVYDNAFKQMQHPGIGTGVNTDPSAPYVTPVTLVINIEFTPNTYTINELDIANFNPFIFVNKNRSIEVHLPDYEPTSLANQALFGTENDNSDASQNRYYKTENNLPWAINIYDSFDYPNEKQAIVLAYLKFSTWANSSGALFMDWYKDLSGYRNNSLIYEIP